MRRRRLYTGSGAIEQANAEAERLLEEKAAMYSSGRAVNYKAINAYTQIYYIYLRRSSEPGFAAAEWFVSQTVGKRLVDFAP